MQDLAAVIAAYLDQTVLAPAPLVPPAKMVRRVQKRWPWATTADLIRAFELHAQIVQARQGRIAALKAEQAAAEPEGLSADRAAAIEQEILRLSSHTDG